MRPVAQEQRHTPMNAPYLLISFSSLLPDRHRLQQACLLNEGFIIGGRVARTTAASLHVRRKLAVNSHVGTNGRTVIYTSDEL
jgi:hypothetical protein